MPARSTNGPNGCNAESPCVANPSFCATSLAGGALSVAWMCPFDVIGSAQPNGAGQYCYASMNDCNSGPNSCSYNGANCTQELSTCNTARAAPRPRLPPMLVRPMPLWRRPAARARAMQGLSAGGTYTWFCTADQPPGSLPNGAGALCYTDAVSCANGINACSDAEPCIVSATVCSTGIAANMGYTFFCPLDPPAGAVPNGASSAAASYRACLLVAALRPERHPRPQASAPTATQTLRSAQPTTRRLGCHSGGAAGRRLTWLAPWPLPSPRNARVPRSCTFGPNACDAMNPCAPNESICATGVAGSMQGTHVSFCQADLPSNALPNGAGLLCYESIDACTNGTRTHCLARTGSAAASAQIDCSSS